MALISITLKDIICKSTPILVKNVHCILHRKYYDDTWNGDRDGYMEVRITDYIEGETNDKSLIQVEIKTAFRGHRMGDLEWHDMSWCAQWEFVTSLVQ